MKVWTVLIDKHEGGYSEPIAIFTTETLAKNCVKELTQTKDVFSRYFGVTFEIYDNELLAE